MTALKPFEVATKFMSGQKYVTISAVPSLVRGLLKNTKNSSSESVPMKAIQATMTEQITKRWDRETSFKDTAPNTVIMSTALDPRYKNLKSLTPQDVLKVQAKVQTLALLARREEMDEQQNAADQTRAAPASTTTPPPEAPPSVLDTLLDSDSESEDGENDTVDLNTEIRNEVHAYFSSKRPPKKEDPLEWWKTNEGKFPSLAKLARSYLCIPGTSTPSERLFSVSGNIVSKKRASLSQEHVDMLTFLHCNSRFMK